MTTSVILVSSMVLSEKDPFFFGVVKIALLKGVCICLDVHTAVAEKNDSGTNKTHYLFQTKQSKYNNK